MPQINIRPAVSTDVNTLMAMDHTSTVDYVWQMDLQHEEEQYLVAFREIRLPRSVVIPYPRPVSLLSESWNRRHGVLIAEEAGTTVGYVRMNDNQVLHTALITDLVVTPRCRRQGIGTALVLAAQSWAANRKNKHVMLETITKNTPAIRLALKLGFDFSGYNAMYYESKDVALFFGRTLG